MLTSHSSTAPLDGPLSFQELAMICGGLDIVHSQKAIRQFLTTSDHPHIKSVQEHFVQARENERSLATDPRHMLGRR